MVELTSEFQETSKWGFLSCLKMKISLQLLWFGLRFWEEQLDIQKMQQNEAWQEGGKVYKRTYMSNLYWEGKYSCSARKTLDCVFQTCCTILISKILAWRNWERYHHLFLFITSLIENHFSIPFWKWFSAQMTAETKCSLEEKSTDNQLLLASFFLLYRSLTNEPSSPALGITNSTWENCWGNLWVRVTMCKAKDQEESKLRW